MAQNLLAVSSFKRDYAKKFDVDVYSSNEVLQKELNSVAWASAAGNLTLSAASMVTGAAVLVDALGRGPFVDSYARTEWGWKHRFDLGGIIDSFG